MEKVFFIELGMGADLHGQSITKAAQRAVHNAMYHNSLPGIRDLLPDGDPQHMKVRVRLAVPREAEKLDHAQIRALIPYGEVTIEVITGGMITSSGVVVPEKGDSSDEIVIVNAAVEVGV